MYFSSERLSYLLIFFLNFLTGVEYGVVIPTALQYLKRYGGDQVDLGFCISAYSFSSLLSSPIMGRISDKTRNTKLIILVANIFQIGGSFMYFMGVSKTLIIGGRLVSGLGLGCLGCVLSDIVKNTQISERSTRLSRVMVGRQIGLIIGPAFNILALGFNYKLGPFVLDNLSAPGLLMAGAWSLLQILVLFFYKNLHEFNKDPAITHDPQDISERTNLINNSIQSNATSYQSSVHIVDNSETGPFLLRLYNNYIRDEVVAVFFTAFSVIFMQTSLETFLTPFTRDYFGWTDAGNSILYAVCGVEIMLVFILLSFISKAVSDRTLLIIGLVGNISTVAFLIVYIPYAIPMNNQIRDYLCFGIPVFFNVFSLPLIVVPSISLLSKVTDIKTQGLTQGMRSAFSGMGQILGPNWAGAFYMQWYIFFGVLIGLLLTSLVMSIISYNKLKGDKQTVVKDETSESASSENIA